MRKSLALIASLTGVVLLTAFSAEAAEGARVVGSGVSQLIQPDVHDTKLQQSKLLITSSVVRKSELEEPLGQKRKDTTSAGISRSAAEPKKNTSEKAMPERTVRITEKKEPESKFGIYHAIKESILDFILPSRKKEAEKVDLSRVQKNARTENPTRTNAQPVR